jgi:hypothetical protein
MPRTPTTVAPKTTAWFRELDGGRIEIFLKITHKGHPERDCKIRAHGIAEDMYELVSWFEARTGTTVQGNWRRVSTAPNPGDNHLTLDIEGAANGELH